ncbi:uncharacterized protein NECHADRAFT_56257 [Fusarium vanettenii 77-13-4]|uniref:Xylanolytic transcriptional activator regulatory domain-containing protein n=1 Tax=Fusarium vanettenii (strain ATCC MYA-4622 / CBS 123669 / FGSC 9596 / NRRL 45880 / 77-13-4) TaxID=660122 RepID=C7ZQL8_FUSV7|nr:uncharacterized protein NECHADRAFT_56257 [Fusarium vanettenii 77-13-4]EEU33686.1 hypothetical protein NECHADRAFT_56257 [Fusarium vanettenii 77-13-4]
MEPAISSASPDTCPSDEVAISLVEQYFNSLYPLSSYNFLHKATVVQRCRDKTIDKALKLAICAITAIYFSKLGAERDAWTRESERLILDRLERPSIFQLQASLLVTRYRVSMGQLSRTFMMAGLAGRWAAALRLNYEHSGLRPAAQEVRRRTFWSLYLLDENFSSESKGYELFHPDTIHLQLPCEEIDFTEERLVNTGYQRSDKGLEPRAIGLHAAFAKLTFIRRRIRILNRRLFLKEINIFDLLCSIEEFENDLLRLRSWLAPSGQYPPSDPIKLYRSPQHASLHLSWHQCYCDLYGIFLTQYPGLSPYLGTEGITPTKLALMKDKCFGHTEEIVEILSSIIQQKDEGNILEFDVAVCAYHSARLILFGTCTGGYNTGLPMQMAIDKAQLCLDVITQCFGFASHVEPIRQDLERLIRQHRLWLESPGRRDVAAADVNPWRPSQTSTAAYIRERLAIHNLLRQSDNDEDGCDASRPNEGC